jgi:hypothetical protein
MGLSLWHINQTFDAVVGNGATSLELPASWLSVLRTGAASTAKGLTGPIVRKQQLAS